MRAARFCYHAPLAPSPVGPPPTPSLTSRELPRRTTSRPPRQTVHQWLRRYANEGGLGGLADLAEAGLVPAADARCGGGAGSGGAAGASGVGAVADPLAAGAGGCRAAARAVGCVP